MTLVVQELRLAAEAGFDELLRQQELDRARGGAGQQMDTTFTGPGSRHRSPYRSPLGKAHLRALEAAGSDAVQVTLVAASSPHQNPTVNVIVSPEAAPESRDRTGPGHSKFSDITPLQVRPEMLWDYSHRKIT